MVYEIELFKAMGEPERHRVHGVLTPRGAIRALKTRLQRAEDSLIIKSVSLITLVPATEWEE